MDWFIYFVDIQIQNGSFIHTLSGRQHCSQGRVSSASTPKGNGNCWGAQQTSEWGALQMIPQRIDRERMEVILIERWV